MRRLPCVALQAGHQVLETDTCFKGDLPAESGGGEGGLENGDAGDRAGGRGG